MPKRESAGLLMYNTKDGKLRVLLAHPGGPFFAKKDAGYWTIPKGEPNKGEDLLTTAQREFEEETGLKAEGDFFPLGSITQKGGKVVHAWAFRGQWEKGRKPASSTFSMEWLPRSGKKQRFPEIDRAKMFSARKAKIKIKSTQYPLIERLLVHVQTELNGGLEEKRYITPQETLKHRFRNNPMPQWDAAVILFRGPGGSQQFIDAFGAKPLGYKTIWGMEETKGNYHAYEMGFNGMKVGVISRCNVGGPQAAIVIEELAAMGVKTIIGYGISGSIDPALKKGDQVYIREALLTDGTSRHYATQTPVIDKKMEKAIQTVSQKAGVPISPATAVTVDAVYRETEDAVKYWTAMGGQILNMEAAPFYAVSRKCGIRSILIGQISDCITGEDWEPWHDLEEATETSIKITQALMEEVFQAETSPKRKNK